MLLRIGTVLVVSLAGLGCTAFGGGSKPQAARHWDGTVRVDGALRAMFHEGQTGAAVNLDSLLPNPNLYAVGALADLAGEVNIIAGVAYLSYCVGPQETRTGASHPGWRD